MILGVVLVETLLDTTAIRPAELRFFASFWSVYRHRLPRKPSGDRL